MDASQKARACKLVEMLKHAGEHHGLLVVQGNVVIRNGVLAEDAPAMYDVADLDNAVALGLLEQSSVSGSMNWEWYVVKKP